MECWTCSAKLPVSSVSASYPLSPSMVPAIKDAPAQLFPCRRSQGRALLHLAHCLTRGHSPERRKQPGRRCQFPPRCHFLGTRVALSENGRCARLKSLPWIDPFSIAYICMLSGLTTGIAYPVRETIPGEAEYYLSQHSVFACSSLLRNGGILWGFLHLHWHVYLYNH